MVLLLATDHKVTTKYLCMSLENVSKLMNLQNGMILKVQTKRLPTVCSNRRKNMEFLPFVKRSHYLHTYLAEFRGKMWKWTSGMGQEAFGTCMFVCGCSEKEWFGFHSCAHYLEECVCGRSLARWFWVWAWVPGGSSPVALAAVEQVVLTLTLLNATQLSSKIDWEGLLQGKNIG